MYARTDAIVFMQQMSLHFYGDETMFIKELHAHVYAKDDASMFMQEFTCGIWLAKITFTAF